MEANVVVSPQMRQTLGQTTRIDGTRFLPRMSKHSGDGVGKTRTDSPERRIEKGQRLQAKREALGYTITWLAEHSGVSPNTIRAAERGERCHRSSLQRITDVLNAASPDALPSKQPLLLEDLDIAALYHDAPTSLRNFISQLLKARDYATYQGPDPALIAKAHELSQLTAAQRDSIEALITHYRTSASQLPVRSASRRQTKPDKTK